MSGDTNFCWLLKFTVKYSNSSLLGSKVDSLLFSKNSKLLVSTHRWHIYPLIRYFKIMISFQIKTVKKNQPQWSLWAEDALCRSAGTFTRPRWRSNALVLFCFSAGFLSGGWAPCSSAQIAATLWIILNFYVQHARVVGVHPEEKRYYRCTWGVLLGIEKCSVMQKQSNLYGV